MAVNFKGKVALVTGAGKGIGRAIAVKLAELGAKVYGISRTQSDLDNLMAEVPSIQTANVDISDWFATRTIVEAMGPIDLLVNNAAIVNVTSFLDVTKEELDNLDDINYKAAFNISQVVSKGMVARGLGGSIVNISSIAGQRAFPNHTLYCSSKAALDMLSQTLALELGPHKIRVNSINPTIVMTTLGQVTWGDPVKRANALSKIPIGRLAEVEDVVNATVFLLSEQASMVTGIKMPVDGGMITTMAANFEGKVALVTGAGKGIGRAIAVKLAELGAKVYGISRTQSDLDNLMAEVPSIQTANVDISDWFATRKVVEDMGPIDLLVNNAGITNWSGFLDVTKEEFDDLTGINYTAAFNISQVVAKGMVAKGNGGAIVNISSIAAQRAIPNHTLYCSAKAALDMLSKTLALELGPHKIRVNSINPTIVLTTLGKVGWSDPVKKANAISKIPIGRLAEEEDVVNATVFLLSEKASMITGIEMPVDGGMIVSCV